MEQAVNSQDIGHHDWACFAAHQAAEKAVKALHLHFHQEAWGHVVGRLLSDLSDVVDVPHELVEKAQVLDGHYYSSRYPCYFPEGAPCEHYNHLQSGDALKYAREILQFARTEMAQG